MPVTAAALLLGSAAPAPAQIRFVDVAASAGVVHVVHNSESPERYQIEPMIAGVALFDYDGDGLLDIYLCNGAAVPGLKKDDPGFSNRPPVSAPRTAVRRASCRIRKRWDTLTLIHSSQCSLRATIKRGLRCQNGWHQRPEL